MANVTIKDDDGDGLAMRLRTGKIQPRWTIRFTVIVAKLVFEASPHRSTLVTAPGSEAASSSCAGMNDHNEANRFRPVHLLLDITYCVENKTFV